LENGLSRTEHHALSVLWKEGSLTGPRLFVAVQGMEEHVFMGDSSFYRIVTELSEARHPLVQVSDTLTLTQTGRDVLEGRSDHVDLNGIDRGLGGVHLEGDKVLWRWDRVGRRLVS